MPSLAKTHPKHRHQPTPTTTTSKRTQAKLDKAATYRTTERNIRSAISEFQKTTDRVRARRAKRIESEHVANC